VAKGPGADEDAQGLPFVGRAGKTAEPSYRSLGLQRKDGTSATLVKLPASENRQPEEDEVSTCSPFLSGQDRRHRSK